MHTSCLYSDIDWLIYADYLDDQNINHFIREDLQKEEIPWDYEYRTTGFVGVGSVGVGVAGVGVIGVGGVVVIGVGGVGVAGVGNYHE
jgi:hypothetical protein